MTPMPVCHGDWHISWHDAMGYSDFPEYREEVQSSVSQTLTDMGAAVKLGANSAFAEVVRQAERGPFDAYYGDPSPPEHKYPFRYVFSSRRIER